MLLRKAKCVVTQLPSGQGKTFIALLVALYEIRQHKKDKVVIVTASKTLQDQLDQDIQETVPDDIAVTSDFDFDRYGDYQVLIIDEADYVLQNSAIKYDKTAHKLQGLYLMTHVPKVYMFSATIPKFTSELAKKLFNCDPQDRLVFKSKYELTTKQSHINLTKDW